MMQDAASRLSERINWSTIQFLLENAVFLLIGLQIRWIVADVRRVRPRPGRSSPSASRVLAAVRPAAADLGLPGRATSLVRRRSGRAGRAPSWRATRSSRGPGCAAWSRWRRSSRCPEDTPQREVLVLVAMVVTAGTLLLQGSTCRGWPAGCGVPGPDPRGGRAAGGDRTAGRAVAPGCATLDELRRRDRPAGHGRHAAASGSSRGSTPCGSGWAARTPRGDAERGVPPGAAADAARPSATRCCESATPARSTTRCSSR